MSLPVSAPSPSNLVAPQCSETMLTPRRTEHDERESAASSYKGNERKHEEGQPIVQELPDQERASAKTHGVAPPPLASSDSVQRRVPIARDTYSVERVRSTPNLRPETPSIGPSCFDDEPKNADLSPSGHEAAVPDPSIPSMDVDELRRTPDPPHRRVGNTTFPLIQWFFFPFAVLLPGERDVPAQRVALLWEFVKVMLFVFSFVSTVCSALQVGLAAIQMRETAPMPKAALLFTTASYRLAVGSLVACIVGVGCISLAFVVLLASEGVQRVRTRAATPVKAPPQDKAVTHVLPRFALTHRTHTRDRHPTGSGTHAAPDADSYS